MFSVFLIQVDGIKKWSRDYVGKGAVISKKNIDKDKIREITLYKSIIKLFLFYDNQPWYDYGFLFEVWRQLYLV